MVNLHLKITIIPLISTLFKNTGCCMVYMNSVGEISPNFLCVGASDLSNDLLL